MIIDQFASSSIIHSITSSVLNYRTIQGRTFHSEKHNSIYFIPNDEQQLQSVDITYVPIFSYLDAISISPRTSPGSPRMVS